MDVAPNDLSVKERQRRLLARAMTTVTSQFGGIKWFEAVIGEAAELAAEWGHPESFAANRSEAGAYYARLFLHLVLTVEMSLRRASYPFKGKLPAQVADILTAGSPFSGTKGRSSYSASVNPTEIDSWAELYTMFGTNTPFANEWSDLDVQLESLASLGFPATPDCGPELLDQCMLHDSDGAKGLELGCDYRQNEGAAVL